MILLIAKRSIGIISMTKKKYPKIEPKFIENQKHQKVEVILDLNVYQSIFDEMNELKDKISSFKKNLKMKKDKNK